jgi:hypothetical protein
MLFAMISMIQGGFDANCWVGFGTSLDGSMENIFRPLLLRHRLHFQLMQVRFKVLSWDMLIQKDMPRGWMSGIIVY